MEGIRVKTGGKSSRKHTVMCVSGKPGGLKDQISPAKETARFRQVFAPCSRMGRLIEVEGDFHPR